MKTVDTSPKVNKVIVVYNYFFFKSLLRMLYAHNTSTIIDASGTVWDMVTIKEILTSKRKEMFK